MPTLSEISITMPKGATNKQYTPEFKKMAMETMQKKLSYSEAARQFEINDLKRIAA